MEFVTSNIQGGSPGPVYGAWVPAPLARLGCAARMASVLMEPRRAPKPFSVQALPGRG